MTTITKLELEDYSFQKSPNFHPQTWRNYEIVKNFDYIFSDKEREYRIAKKRL